MEKSQKFSQNSNSRNREAISYAILSFIEFWNCKRLRVRSRGMLMKSPAGMSVGSLGHIDFLPRSEGSLLG